MEVKIFIEDEGRSLASRCCSIHKCVMGLTRPDKEKYSIRRLLNYNRQEDINSIMEEKKERIKISDADDSQLCNLRRKETLNHIVPVSSSISKIMRKKIIEMNILNYEILEM